MLLQFCPVCDNMLYIRTTDEGTQYHCRSCRHVQAIAPDKEAVCVTDTLLSDDAIRYMRYVSPMLHTDPSMPHSASIPCRSEHCTRPPGEASDVVVVKYDYERLRFLYSCAHCKAFWVSADAAPGASG